MLSRWFPVPSSRSYRTPSPFPLLDYDTGTLSKSFPRPLCQGRHPWKREKWHPFLIPLDVSFQCSEECGRGIKQREITCVDTGVNINHEGVLSGEVQVHSDYCLREGLSKPREKRGCNTQPCSFRWASSAWSEVHEFGSSVRGRCHALLEITVLK